MTKEDRRIAMMRIFQMPQAAALLAEVRETWEDYAKSISAQTMAAHHGCIEHCAGSMHGVETVENRLRQAAKDAEGKRGQKGNEE